MRRAAAVIGLTLVFIPPQAAPGATPHRLSARWQPIGATVDGRHVQRRAWLTGRVSAVAGLGGNPPAELLGTVAMLGWDPSRPGLAEEFRHGSYAGTAIHG